VAELPNPSADARPTNAGVVTRGLAAVVDAAVVLGLVVAAYAVEAAVIFLLDPRGFVPPDTGVSWFVDLGAIIRESSESVTSDAVQSVRTRGSEADVAIGRTVDRLLRRRPHPAV